MARPLAATCLAAPVAPGPCGGSSRAARRRFRRERSHGSISKQELLNFCPVRLRPRWPVANTCNAAVQTTAVSPTHVADGWPTPLEDGDLVGFATIGIGGPPGLLLPFYLPLAVASQADTLDATCRPDLKPGLNSSALPFVPGPGVLAEDMDPVAEDVHAPLSETAIQGVTVTAKFPAVAPALQCSACADSYFVHSGGSDVPELREHGTMPTCSYCDDYFGATDMLLDGPLRLCRSCWLALHPNEEGSISMLSVSTAAVQGGVSTGPVPCNICHEDVCPSHAETLMCDHCFGTHQAFFIDAATDTHATAPELAVCSWCECVMETNLLRYFTTADLRICDECDEHQRGQIFSDTDSVDPCFNCGRVYAAASLHHNVWIGGPVCHSCDIRGEDEDDYTGSEDEGYDVS